MAITTLLLILIPAILLRDESGQALGWPGAFVWVAVSVLAFLLTLLFLSAFLLPAGAQPEGEGHFPDDVRAIWQDGLVLLRRYLRTALVPWGQGDRREVAGLSEETADVLQRFGATMIDSHLALALFKGTTFSRAVGPGYVRLRPGERVAQVIDLRLQHREQTVTVVTRDGIPLEMTVSVTFRIRQPKTTEQFPYVRDGITSLTGGGCLGPEGETIPWHERICPLAANTVTDVICRFRLDQLFETPGGESSRLASIGDNIKPQLETRLASLFHHRNPGDPERDGGGQGEEAGGSEDSLSSPVEIETIDIGAIKVPKHVVEQRIESWREQWEAYERRQQFEGEAEVSKHLQHARAQAQIEMLDNLTQRLGTLKPPLTEEDWNETVLLRMIAALENTIIDDDAHPDVLGKILGSLVELTRWLK